jgi:hypothetical protein
VESLEPLAGLENLEDLYLWDSRLPTLAADESSSLEPLAGLTNLKVLCLCWNQNPDPDSTTNLPNLDALAGLTGLTTLIWWGNGTSNISGLSGLTSLETLYLDGNDIADVGPLAGLESLVELSLTDNDITDILPLVLNPGVGAGDTIELAGNPLSVLAACIDIPALIARGAIVDYPPGCDGTPSPDSDGDGFTDWQEVQYLRLFYPDLAEVRVQCQSFVSDGTKSPPYGPDSSDPRDFSTTMSCLPTTGVNISIEGQGTVSGLPAGTYRFAKYVIDCEDPCASPDPPSCGYNRVTLTATPAPGSMFKRWRGNVVRRAHASVDLKMSRDYTVTAEFVQRPAANGIDFVTDLAAFLTALGIPEPSYETFDLNNVQYDDAGEREYVGNGIPDAAELYLLQKVLETPSIDLSQSSGIVSDVVYDAWTKNITQAQYDLQDFDPHVQRGVAAYMSLGDFETVEMLKWLIQQNQQASGIFSGYNLNTDAYDRTCQQYFYYDNDADNDGLTNLEEWQNASPDNSLDHLEAFVTAALDGNSAATAGGVNGAASRPVAEQASALSTSSQATPCPCAPPVYARLGYPPPAVSVIPPGCSVALKSNGVSLPMAIGEDVALALGQEVEVTAVPGPGYAFVRWSVETFSGAGTFTAAVNGSRNKKQRLVLTKPVTVFEPEFQTGIVSVWPVYPLPSPPYPPPLYPLSIACDYDDAIVELPDSGDGWRQFQGPMGSRMTISATTTAPHYMIFADEWAIATDESLTIALMGSGYVEVDVLEHLLPAPSDFVSSSCSTRGMGSAGVMVTDNGGIFPENVSSYWFEYGVWYVARPAAGYAFKGWEGYPCHGASGDYYCWDGYLDPDGDAEIYFQPPNAAPSCVTAVFEKAEEYSLTLHTRATGEGACRPPCAGDVTVSPGQKYYMKDATYGTYTTVSLTAEPRPGYILLKWDGHGNTLDGTPIRDNTSPYLNVLMDCDRNVIAVFKRVNVDFKFRSFVWDQEQHAYVVNWVDTIKAVVGDAITINSMDDPVIAATHAWDFNESANADSSDADRDDLDEADDDTDATGQEVTVSYHPLANQDPEPADLRLVTLNVNCPGTLLATDTGLVDLHEVLLVEGVGTWGSSSAGGILHFHDHLVDSMNQPTPSSLLDELPHHDILIFNGHGSGPVINAEGDVGLAANEVNIGRRSPGTPMGTERTYRFVFLNSCRSADAATDWMSALATDAFVGWHGPVGEIVALAFDHAFWDRVAEGESTVSATVGANADIAWAYLANQNDPSQVYPQYQGSIVLCPHP